jgi:PPM family protein phosphatase
MKWYLEKAEHIGGRNEQQDNVAIFSTDNGKTHLLVVADGMGGHQGGRLASQTVIKSAQQAFEKYQSGQKITSPPKFLQYICELAHDNINQLEKQYGFSPHSTCVLLYIHNQKAWWAHVGDSRLYHFRHKKLLLRTKDQSVVQLFVDLGRITEEEMATHPDQGRLLSGLGGKEPVKPEFDQAIVRPGDSFVLCSDGFWEHVSPPKMINSLLQKNFSLKRRVNKLIKEALDAGGAQGDNIALVVAQLKGKNILNIIIYTLLMLIVIATGGIFHWLYY